MDERDLTLLSLWVHVPVVTVWIGLVMWDLFAAAIPGLSPVQRGRMIVWSRLLVILMIAVIMVTGVWQTMKNPFLEVTNWDTLQDLKKLTYGYSLFLKHGFVIATFLLTLAVRFVLGPKLLRGAAPAADDADTVVTSAGGGTAAAVATGGVERQILWLSALNLLACLGALIMTTRMVWQLH